MVELEQYRISGSTASEIAASAESAIRDGGLQAGAALPTVRGLAATLGTSPATVSSAYRTLRLRGLVVADGRRGTRVARRPALRPRRAPRARRSMPGVPTRRDLTIGLADPALLPSLADALARIDLEAKLATGELESVDPELLDLAASMYAADGVPTQAVTVLSGALDAVERVLGAHLRPGDRVLIEDPAYPPLRDLLLSLGLSAVPVGLDDRGCLPDSLAAGLERGAAALVVMPRAQNPLGAALDADRAAELRDVLAAHPAVLLVEDDHAGAVAGPAYVSLVSARSTRWAVVRSASKVLHPELRLAFVAGDELTIARAEGRQALGPRWVSRILQALALELMRDPAFERTVARAREVYAARRQALLASLAERGVPAHGRSGLNIWVPVREEAPVVSAALDAGWLVLAGEPFRLASAPGIRITTAVLPELEAPRLADVLAAVEHEGRPVRLY